MLDGVMFGIFSLGIVLVLSAIYNLLAIKKPGFYPPKTLLKKRAMIFASGGVIAILIGIILLIF